jgi:signal transduction histidine kinase
MIARLEQMLDAQRRLLADTSHELRNPVTIIRGNLALLKRERVPDEVKREAVLEADDEAARMGRLVSDLLLLARADAGESPPLQMQPVDLVELASEVVDQARPRAGQRRLSLEVVEPVLTVLGDRDRLKQLIANLVENAMRYTPVNGAIDLRVERELQHPPGPARSRPAPMALLSVTDTGIGIAAEDLPHLFERFYRADKARSRAGGGSGLGLAIALYIAQAHAGSIDATSAGPNQGSTFRVRLPLLATSPVVESTERPAADQPIAPAALPAQ